MIEMKHHITFLTVFRRILPLGLLLAAAATFTTPVLSSSSQNAHAVLFPTTRLLLPQSNAFAILGHSCGGIGERVYATGFDPTSGYPTGVVRLTTTCSSGGHGSPPTTYTAWAAVTWDFAAGVVSAMAL